MELCQISSGVLVSSSLGSPMKLVTPRAARTNNANSRCPNQSGVSIFVRAVCDLIRAPQKVIVSCIGANWGPFKWPSFSSANFFECVDVCVCVRLPIASWCLFCAIIYLFFGALVRFGCNRPPPPSIAPLVNLSRAPQTLYAIQLISAVSLNVHHNATRKFVWRFEYDTAATPHCCCSHRLKWWLDAIRRLLLCD